MSTLACVAVLSDIHGVLPALDAVLAEPAVATAEPLTKVAAVVCGHTDMPFTRLLDRRLVINPGSSDADALRATPLSHHRDGSHPSRGELTCRPLWS